MPNIFKLDLIETFPCIILLLEIFNDEFILTILLKILYPDTIKLLLINTLFK